MAQETIEIIRQAELDAEKREKDATAEAERIVAKAHEDAKELIESLTRMARDQSALDLNEIDAQSESEISQTLHQAEQEVVGLREAVQKKEVQAVQMILSELI